MKRFIAFSGGVESTTMCLLYGANAKAIFSDTGWEHQLMYERLEKVEKQIKEIHPGFEIIRVRSKWGNLKDYIKDKKFYPSPFQRYCTYRFKIEPIDKFLKSQGECELMIGLNADEKERSGNPEELPNVTYSYPLIKNNLTRKNCIELLDKVELTPNLPVYMQRGGCVGCFFKSKKEFRAMALLNPEEFKQVEELENEIQDKREEFFTILPNTSMKGIRTQGELFSTDEIYLSDLDVSTPCGVYCHR